MAPNTDGADRLYDFMESLIDDSTPPHIREEFLRAKRQHQEAKGVVENPPEVALRDMPEGVLDGRLGEICQKRLNRFPIAYAWPALVTAASALVGSEAGVRTNLYTALVGPVHSGKSQAIDNANFVLGLSRPALMDTVAGSAEALIRETASAAGNPRLFCPDELGHTLEKLKIERSSFSFILNTAFYKTNFRVLMGKKENANFDCSLSILGGLVEERFSDLFNAASTGGLYDRFLFALCPGGFQFEYRPFEGLPEIARAVPVRIDPYVWEAKIAWEKSHPGSNPRVVEICIRIATICASLDGKQVLQVEDLGPHFQLAKYQQRIREVLRPNPGENFEGQLAHKFLQYLQRLNGAFIDRRELFRHTRAYDKGPGTADRALNVLIANGDIHEQKLGRKRLVRWISDVESGDV